MGSMTAGADEALVRAVQRLQAGDLEDAADLVAGVTARWPERADAWHLQGVVAYRGGALASARTWIERAIAIAPEVAAYRVNLGNVQRAAGEIAAAVAAFEDALALEPENARVWCNLGNALGDTHDFAGAERAYRRAVEIDPVLGDGWQGLVWALAQQGRFDAVEPVHRAWLEAAPDDPAARWLAGVDASPDAVGGYFDRFASTYEAVLDGIDYRVPHELAALLPPAQGAWSVLDAGCGSGRAGAIVRPWAHTLVGVDVSAQMLALAEATGSYDALVHADLLAILRERAFDLVFAADVLPYMEDPSPLFAAVRRIAFSVELAHGSGVERRALGRFAHGEEIVRAALEHAGLGVVAERRAALRREGEAAVEGLLVLAARA